MIVRTEVLLQGMRDMLHDRGEKRKALTGAGQGYETVGQSAAAVNRSQLEAYYLLLLLVCFFPDERRHIKIIHPL